MASFSLVKYNRFAVKKSATSLTVLFNASSTEDPSAPCSPPDQSSRGNRAEAITLANACKDANGIHYAIGRAQQKSPQAIRALFSAVERNPIHAFTSLHVPLRHIQEEKVPDYDGPPSTVFNLASYGSIALIDESLSLVSLCLSVARGKSVIKRVRGHWSSILAWIGFVLDVVVDSDEIDAETSESLVDGVLSFSWEILASVNSTEELDCFFPGLVDLLLQRWLKPDIFSGERDRLQRLVSVGLGDC